jgi:hypothetical protein
MSPTAGPDLYPQITQPLADRGLETYVDFGLSDLIITVPLPHERRLVISPPQEPAVPHPPGRPTTWLVTLDRDNPPEHEVVYDSRPGGPDAAHQGHPNALLVAIDRRLDRLGIQPRPAPRPRTREGTRAIRPTPAQVRALVAIRDGDVWLRETSIRRDAYVTAPGVSTSTVRACEGRDWISIDTSTSLFTGQALALTPTGAAALADAEQTIAALRTSPARARRTSPATARADHLDPPAASPAPSGRPPRR